MEEKTTKVIISGCTGRMGKLVVEAIKQHPNWEIVCGFGIGEHQYDFTVLDARDVDKFEKDILPSNPDVIIDFSTGKVAEFVYYHYALEYDIPFVCATTNLPSSLTADMKAQTVIPVFQAYNLAYDVYVFTRSVAELTAKLPNCDIDVREIHHTGKKDAPSGTALNIALAINEALGHTHTVVVHPPLGNSLRKEKEIHVHSERKGSYAGTHIVTLTLSNNYTITLQHEAFSPQIFATGAIKAAEFLLTQPAGYYNMSNI